jgi:predicted enzyme related to lactoylglutathione lyase
MLNEGRVATRLPAQDLERARSFYADKLGLQPFEERDGGLRYVCAAGEFALFESAGAPSGGHTQMGWEVDDIEATTRARAAESGARGSATARATCWELGSRFGAEVLSPLLRGASLAAAGSRQIAPALIRQAVPRSRSRPSRIRSSPNSNSSAKSYPDFVTCSVIVSAMWG